MSFDKMVSFGSDGMEPDAINTTKLAEKYPDMNLKFGLFDTIQPKNCGSLWKTTVVLWNGDVLPCCMAMQRTIDRVPMGNLKKQTFKEIWNNKEFVAYRNCLKNNKKYGVCWRCAMV
jgi:radical SAM protein with 4Fe4S-binding SPASM domain